MYLFSPCSLQQATFIKPNLPLNLLKQQKNNPQQMEPNRTKPSIECGIIQPFQTRL